MTLKLELTPEQMAKLHRRAAEAGLPPDAVAQTLFDHALDEAGRVRPLHETATPQEWTAAFTAWVNSHDPNGPVLTDDSREGIYEDPE